ncbi:MAG: suppressor of fused domain protein [Clostridia bacterium]|nr:suppressor of fused domain protein [Clostridia bacterium]
MKQREMDKLIKHFDQYFEQSDCLVLHPIVDDGYHIDVLLYKPNGKYPFWKLVTMGASDYKMPPVANSISQYNEYIMFVDESEDLNDKEIANWYRCKLVMIATFAHYNQTHITYGHSFEWENDDSDDEMIAAFIEFPQVVENVGILRCKLGMFKTVACLQTVLLNKNELDLLTKIGPEAFSEYLYPEEDDKKQHFLSEKRRSEKF